MLAETICRIKKTGLMGIVRVETIERGIEIAQGCIDGGVDVLEISYTNNNAGEVIRALKEKFGDQLLVGAGTVLDPTTARLAIMDGGRIHHCSDLQQRGTGDGESVSDSLCTGLHELYGNDRSIESGSVLYQGIPDIQLLWTGSCQGVQGAMSADSDSCKRRSKLRQSAYLV